MYCEYTQNLFKCASDLKEGLWSIRVCANLSYRADYISLVKSDQISCVHHSCTQYPLRICCLREYNLFTLDGFQ